MSLPDAPEPRRLARPRWLDPRVIGGILLIIAAVVIGARVIGSSRQTTPVLAAARDLAAGTVLSATDLVPREVNLGDGLAHYLAAGSAVAGRALQHPVRSGELVPAGSVGEPLTGRVLVIPVDPDRMPPGVGHGSVIDLYLTTGEREKVSTRLIADRITVQSVAAPASGGLSGASANQYQVAVLLPASRADELIRTLPGGEPTVLLVAGPAR